MVRFKAVLGLLLTILCFSGKAEETAGNGNKLESWLASFEKDEDIFQQRLKDPTDSCYTEDEIDEIFLYDEAEKFVKTTENHSGRLAELNGASGKLIFADKIRQLEAINFVRGVADGQGQLVFNSHHHHASNDSFLAGNFKRGCLHGLIKGYEYLPADGVEQDPSYDKPVLNFAATFEAGRIVAGTPAWKVIFSPDGIVLGYFYKVFSTAEAASLPVNYDLDFASFDDVVFLYPDLKNAIRGRFDRRGVLTAGKRVSVTASRTDGLGMKLLEFTQPFGRALKPNISNKNRLASYPMERDPYEADLVNVDKSKIEKAGDGVFLVKDVAKNTVVSYFNGVRLHKTDVFTWNPFKKASVYLVETSDEAGNDMFLDIPPDMASWATYKATSGHKVNHAKKANSAYTECEHPIYGKILCLYTTENLKAGTELLTQYEVAMDKEGMKTVLKAALEIGHKYTGVPRKQFANQVRPYLELASKFAEKLNVDYLLSF